MIVQSNRALAKELGISHTRINTLDTQGRIKRGPNGWDVDRVREQLEMTLDSAKPSRVQPPRAPERAQQPAHEDDTRELQRSEIGTGTAYDNYNKARAYKESIKAKDAELDLKQRLNELLPADEVKSHLVEMIAMAKTTLMGIGNKLAADLAAEQSPAVCRAMVDDEILEALSELATWEPVRPNAVAA